MHRLGHTASPRPTRAARRATALAARALVGLLLLASTLATAGCDSLSGRTATATTSVVVLPGRVTGDLTTLSAPDPGLCTPAFDIGFTPSAEETPTSPPLSATCESTPRAPATWLRVATLDTPLGTRVSAGDQLLTFDDTALKAAEAAAEADLTRARADSGVVAGMLDDIEAGRAEITSQTAVIQDTIADLEEERADLTTQLEQARRAAATPSQPTTPAPSPTPPATDPAATVRRLEQAIERIDAALERSREGIEKLEDSDDDLAKARDALRGAADAAAALVEAREIGIEIAQARTRLAVLTAPVDGTIVSVAPPGTALAPGAPAVRIQSTGPARVETYVDPVLYRQLTAGTQVTLYADSLPGRAIVGRIVQLGDINAFAPTHFASDDIHLTRAIRVVAQIDSGETLPAGTPADVMFTTRIPLTDGSR